MVQDSTARVWDVRMAGAGSVAVLRGRMGAVRSLRFSPSGAHLAVAEPADFVTLFDVASGFQQAQEVTVSCQTHVRHLERCGIRS